MLPTTFRFIWPSCFRVEDFQKSTNQKQGLPVAVMFVNGSGQNEQQRAFHRCFLPSFGSLAKRFQRGFLEIDQLETCLLTDRDVINNIYRVPSIDASNQVSVHLAERFQRSRLKCEKLTDDRRRTTDDGRRMPSDGKSSHCLWQGKLKIRFEV